MLQVSQLNIYPIKSLGGISKQEVQITNTGFEYDRRWMLVDENNVFLTQRTHPAMALMHLDETNDGFMVTKQGNENMPLLINFVTRASKKIMVKVWDDECEAIEVSKRHNEWFSDMLQINCKLVYMPDSTQRRVDKNYALQDEVVSFADAFPILVIAENSLQNLNEKLAEPLPMNRFRPSLVFTGGHAHIEDEMARFSINGIGFFCVKPCARCVITTINQQTALKGHEPLKTLSTYRMNNNKILFGQNVLQQKNGRIRVGDILTVLDMQAAIF